jgi:hypothetical protein
MSYETRYEMIKEDLRDIMAEIGSSFGRAPEEYIGDDFGYEMGMDAEDGRLVHVTLLLRDGADDGYEGAGNLLLHVNHGDETIMSVIPDNLTDNVFADWGDDELWDDKVDMVRVNVAEIRNTLAGIVGTLQAKL